jgi:D-glycero-alpha-D-manno-heptose 1-phosphate guanylyltransferase
MQVKEAIILAGGLGTRLRDAVPDLPKCMAPVKGKPFISFVTDYLQQQGIERFIFALGYRSEVFLTWLEGKFPLGNYEVVIEKEPLGTGGAIQFAATFAKEENVVVVNGDSIFKTDLAQQAALHFAVRSYCTLALKPMKDFERYGVVELDADQTIASFREKQWYSEGLINGGVYLLNIPAYLHLSLPEKFSFEKDYLEEYYPHKRIYGVVNDGYFIDIGIPEDYLKAQTELY